jgi:hypothetical protein
LENKPCEHDRVGEYGQRPDRRDWIADRMARVHKPNPDSQDNGADNPNPNLWEGQPARFDRRVQTIEDAKQKQRDEAEQIQMGMRRKSRMVVAICRPQSIPPSTISIAALKHKLDGVINYPCWSRAGQVQKPSHSLRSAFKERTQSLGCSVVPGLTALLQAQIDWKIWRNRTANRSRWP